MRKRKSKTRQVNEASATTAATDEQHDSAAPVAEEDHAVTTADEVDWKDRYLRSKADFANLQRRSVEERTMAVRFANADFIRGLLEVIDDFERMLEASEQEESASTVLEGVRLIHTKFLKVLKDNQVEPIDAVGQPFDPNVHEALMQQPSAEPEGTVLQMVQRGYRLHDRVIRPSRVIVAKPVEAVET